MATCNFWTMEKFPLLALTTEDVCKLYLGEEDENGESYNGLYSYEDMQFAWDLFNSDYEVKDTLNELNIGLEWYKGELKYGYYDGVQFYFDTKYIDIKNWDDDECYLEFNLSLEDTKQMIKEDEEAIKKFLECAKQSGFKELVCVGVFSNGEAIYEYA